MQIFGETLAFQTVIFLVLAVGLALFFEAINGFHDTANAVATVIYTHSLKPTVAVVWSGVWNLIGVLTSSGAVAYGIVALLPVELVINAGSGPSYAMVFSLLISAIIWNFGTWYVGLPNSSSHSLIGAIMGVGLAHSLLAPGHSLSEGINWQQVQNVFTSLLVSPIVGFCGAALLLLLGKALIRRPELFRPANQKKAPPWWIRALLILTCTGVSFAHGSNDGQKGMGLLMLILVGILPGLFALNLNSGAANLSQLAAMSRSVQPVIEHHAPKIPISNQDASTELSNFIKTKGKISDKTLPALAAKNQAIANSLSGKQSFQAFSINERRSLRTDMYLVSTAIGKLNKQNKFTAPNEKKALASYQASLDKETKYIPNFVKIVVAFALGIGTMIGWKRIVVTVGEKIGKEHLSYGQGASAELVAMATIEAADQFGLPVSTTHVLSSGVAGTMAASGSGLQMETLRNIALSWVLTLPATTLLGAAFFAASLYAVLSSVGVK
ncbi:MAG: inorganic phosphate transporter [Chroococcidiopsidaceae cyanobacterium CP_BM_ER_R8_30]|nr:inorganic phosphate transporter [Chroococcidiopsidaceae cyanobacterium CP_BM_ER_R8_30]